jgi:hypothetical protein
MLKAATFQEYLRAFTARWFVLMSGPVSVPFTAAALYVENTTAKALLTIMAITCFAFSSYWIWRIEREARLIAENRLQVNDSIHDPWGNLRVADNPEVVRLFLECGPERNKLLALLVQNRIRCWGRRMVGRSDLVMVGRSDLVFVPGSVWNSSSYLRFQARNENDRGGINQTYIRDDNSKRDIFYDVHLNLAQMRRVWPDIQLQEATEDVR